MYLHAFSRLWTNKALYFPAGVYVIYCQMCHFRLEFAMRMDLVVYMVFWFIWFVWNWYKWIFWCQHWIPQLKVMLFDTHHVNKGSNWPKPWFTLFFLFGFDSNRFWSLLLLAMVLFWFESNSGMHCKRQFQKYL